MCISDWSSDVCSSDLPGLDDALHGELDALLGLVQLVGRAVDDDEELGAGFLQAFADVGRPHVLADHDAEAHAAEARRAGQGAGTEHPLLLETAVVRPDVLGALGGGGPLAREIGGGGTLSSTSGT